MFIKVHFFQPLSLGKKLPTPDEKLSLVVVFLIKMLASYRLSLLGKSMHPQQRGEEEQRLHHVH